MSLFANDNNNLPTGEVVNRIDSVLISYDDLRIVNSKLIELNYEKQININLKQVIKNDSIIINDYIKLNDRYKKDCKKITTQRNICFGIAVLVTIFGSIMLLVK